MKVCFDTDLIVRYGGRGPRYTSYPTALQFSDALTADDYREHAIASNATDVPLSLYVHIPFCHSLCYYCGCNKIVTRNQDRVERYLEMLYREIDMQSELFDRSRKIEQLHFGGGTPTYLDRTQLDDLMAKLRAAFTFDESDDREFSIEVDPRTVDESSIRHLAELGFNRLSLGIQDFDPRVQQAVNRTQTTDDVLHLVLAARDAGFESISFDLIYGLPHQTVASFDTTLDLVVGMRPDRLAVYNYAHLPQRFKGQRMINDEDIPSPETKLEILHRTIDTLCDAGYVYIGMDHFALPDDELVLARGNGTLQRNFQGYSTHRECDLVALGVSAIGSIGNVFAQNSVTTMEYEALIESGQLPIRKGIAVDDDDLLRADVIQSLMCYDQLSFDEFGARHNIDFRDYFAAEIEHLKPLADDDLIELTESGVAITQKGRLLLRSIAMVFDRYIDQAQNDNRFSKAI
ncbi:MAG: oxygen-independent coproporphyrinogen III oxidase [Gammaproteobacteria bacterium]|nr:oxygen-independent coproporphyrinogen III oxidase [Gammaproteobacteria bacterium]MDH5241252.1 oxygen-independent coproporphyrinogen III oxidase [Gammaproteobacteria bacterium]MDH5260287.1 oxygen-independent coproporphyrinogen III oxidase [Gammaproteobacteria bacterium]MDH5584001.1 oxygen-independent coproporphyrinogen III oxidase [Gammaproteobacteria bacterium]